MADLDAYHRWYACFCEPKATIGVVEALVDMGIETECPTFEFRRRVPRRKRTETIRKPLIGGIFFCGVEHWPLGPGCVAGVDLERVRRMRLGSKPVEVYDYELWPLRKASTQKTISNLSLVKGDLVEICEGPLKNMIARVVEVEPRTAHVEIGTFSPDIEISTFLLRKIKAE